jgi:ATP-dependent DNA ligase
VEAVSTQVFVGDAFRADATVPSAAWGKLKDDSGLALRFPRFTGRWRDDKTPEDATTTDELVAMYRAARRIPAGT